MKEAQSDSLLRKQCLLKTKNNHVTGMKNTSNPIPLTYSAVLKSINKRLHVSQPFDIRLVITMLKCKII